MVHEHTITLRGPALDGPGVSGHLLRDLFGVLVQGAEQSLRFRLEGRSTFRGTQPAWLRSAADFQMLEIERARGSRTLKLEALSLLESMPDRFEQGTLFDDFDPRRSPLAFFEDALESALAGDEDSERFDHSLLQTCAEFKGVLAAGIDELEIQNGRHVVVEPASLERALRLSRVHYASRTVRLAGRLDTISYSDCRFTLVLQNGARIAGTARDLGADALHSHFGKNVVVTGTADFRPSGRLLRLNAEDVDPATKNEMQIFTSVPRPLLGPPVVEREAVKGGLAAIAGRWPGEESIEELLLQLKALG
ncbi:MAG: hypothetical protein Q8L14_28670 [Myxococcales bacterium]|nr:hypothetical protein [Myxococcales bacterium]